MALAVSMMIRVPKSSYSCTTHLFKLQGRDAARRLNEIEAQVVVRRGTILFREADLASRLFVVCEGEIKISSGSSDGRVMILRLVGPGGIVGLSAVLNGTEYEMSAEALKPTILKTVSRPDFLGFLATYAEVGEHTARALAKKCSEAHRDARRLGLSATAAGRLALLLLEWVSTAETVLGRREFTMGLTHEELAHMAGMSRETATRLLNQFERAGLISRHRTAYAILDKAGLESMVA